LAINPTAIRLAARAAVAVVTDEEARRRVILIAIAPFAAFVLLVSLIFYALTMPLQLLGSFFADNGYDSLRALRIQYGYDQYLDPSDADWQNGAIRYEEITFTDCLTPVVYYSQLDSLWKDLPYGLQGTVGSSGCGPTALAMAVSSLTSRAIDPAQMADWAYQNGYKCEGNGSYLSLIPEGARHFGLAVDAATLSNTQAIVDALASGKLVVAIMSPGHFTKGGHFIVLRGVTAERKILVADPSSYARSEQEWDLSIILSEARRGAGAGSPFWILGIS
jgi:hypothetical protein